MNENSKDLKLYNNIFPFYKKERVTLEIEDLYVSYNGLEIIKGLNLNFKEGEALSIIGESGAGKTTLGLSMLGLVKGECRGKICFNGENIFTLREEELRKKRGKQMAMVFQNVEEALHPLYTIRDQIMEALILHQEQDNDLAQKKVCDMLNSVGLDEKKLNAFSHQLSGGEKQRALIALALINDPDLLILDEPTASLDVLTKAEILKMLKRVTKNKITMVITHDISTAAKLTENLAVLYDGRIVEWGNTNTILENPRHPYTRGLLRSFPNMTTTKDLQGIPGRMLHEITGCAFHPRCTQKTKMCPKEIPKLSDHGGRYIACHRGGIVPLVESIGLTKYFGSLKAIDHLNLTIYEGETISLVGESGSGKTTFSKTLMGIYKQDEGDVIFNGQRILKRDGEFYQNVQMIFQNPWDSISHRMTVFQAVKEPLDIHSRGDKEDKIKQVRRVLEEVELISDDNFLGKFPHHLSGGEIQRVAIARALILNPKILIADEPTSALDSSVQAKILKLLLNLQEKRGLSILFISHNIALARKVSDRMAVMLKGKIIEEGPTSDLISNPLHPYTQNFLSFAPSLKENFFINDEISSLGLGFDLQENYIYENLDKKMEPTKVCDPAERDLKKQKWYKKKPVFLEGNREIEKDLTDGCPYALLCPKAMAHCFTNVPVLNSCNSHKVACFLRDILEK